MEENLFAALLIGLIVGLFIGWRFFMSNTNFSEKAKFFYIRTGHANYQEVHQSFIDSNFVKNPSSFDFLANRMEVWNKLRPGHYEIRKRNEPIRNSKDASQRPANASKPCHYKDPNQGAACWHRWTAF